MGCKVCECGCDCDSDWDCKCERGRREGEIVKEKKEIERDGARN